ncbi:MAG: polysaccharide ABC transporter ATP-binding protein [Gemmataceae bacterium]|nr:polysaccharide ABC transporter ATP-binding protein [Gemmataceae bacterium]
MNDVVIRADRLGKQYRIGGRAPYQTLRERLNRLMTAPFRWRRRGAADRAPAAPFWALRDVSFEVRQGDVVGIVGRNGAGKSTLLKILSRITEPTEGAADLIGRVGSLLEVGTGFHPELTGRENIYLNGAVLGMKRVEITRKFDEIVAFAEVEQFIDTPVKFYSSGMYMRLAFAVAAHLEPENLVVDEVLAVGDARFQSKCLDKMSQVSTAGRTVLFVSHNMSAITRLCTRALLLDRGRLVLEGPATDVVSAYLARDAESGTTRTWEGASAPGNEQLRLTHVGLFGADGKPCPHIVSVEDELHLRIGYEVRVPRLRFRVSAMLMAQGSVAFSTLEPVEAERQQGFHVSTVTIPAHLLGEEEYAVSVSLFGSRGVKSHFAGARDVLVFQVTDPITGQSARGDYAERLIGAVRPRLAWHSRPEASPSGNSERQSCSV